MHRHRPLSQVLIFALTFILYGYGYGLGAQLAWAQEQPHGHDTMSHDKASHDAMSLEQYIARLEDPKRDVWQKPDAVIQALKLQEGDIVADIGAGSGYFTLRLAQAVGPQGMLYLACSTTCANGCARKASATSEPCRFRLMIHFLLMAL